MIERAFDKPGEHEFLGRLRSGWVHSDRAACVGHHGRQLRHRPRFSMRRHRAPSRKELAPLLDDIRQVMLSCHHRRSQPKRSHPVRQVVGHDHAGGERPFSGARAEKLDRGGPVKRDRRDQPSTQHQVIGVRGRLGDQRTRRVRPMLERGQQYGHAFYSEARWRKTARVDRGEQRFAPGVVG
jgi:hypothetical protein